MDSQKTNEELFRQYLDGELSSEEEIRALHMIAENEEMRELLSFERTLFQTFSGEPDPESFTVPANFSDSVMDRIAQKQPEVKKEKQEGGVILSLFKPKNIAIRPVYAMAAILLLSFGFGYMLLNESEQEMFASAYETEASAQLVSETESEVWIRFVYFDEDAESIEVAGDFSDWDPVALSREFVGDKQVWTGLIPVTRGEHRYMFVKDGEEWITDPLAAMQRDDGFGNKNAVLYL
ncbi:MAG: hypothetical protein EA390_05435 [Balneolaceae bacterium]|nr:MAG: hypothetical protein EA390_05435 [Balneolaceae bacterium]